MCVLFTALPRVGVERPNGPYVASTPGVLVANMRSRIYALTEHLLPGDERSDGEIKFSPSRYVYSYEKS